MVRFLLIAVLSSTSVALRRSGKTDLVDSTGEADLAEELGQPVDLSGELTESSENDEDETADGKETELPPAAIAEVEQLGATASTHRDSLDAQCGRAGSRTRIVNGENARECMWRWQVILKKEMNGGLKCGGSLIHPKWVLTAAHCFDYGDLNWVVAGEHDLKSPSDKEQIRKVKEIYIHKDYESYTVDFDFALMELVSPFQQTPCVGTVCLPEPDDNGPGAGRTVWITGFGTVEQDGAYPTILQQAQVDIISTQACKNAKITDYYKYEVMHSMMCAQGKDDDDVIDACQGDSGGPLVTVNKRGRWTIYGVTSWGRGCAQKKFPGIWARVVRVKGWIKETVRRR